jgi:hypothetical protein
MKIIMTCEEFNGLRISEQSTLLKCDPDLLQRIKKPSIDLGTLNININATETLNTLKDIRDSLISIDMLITSIKTELSIKG